MNMESDKERILARMAVRTLNREGYPKAYKKRPNLMRRTAMFSGGTIVALIGIVFVWAKGDSIDDFFTTDIQENLLNYGMPIFLVSGLFVIWYLKRKR